MNESYKKLFLDLVKSKNYIVHKPSFHDKKNSVDYILEGKSNGQVTEVKVDIKKKNGKNSNNWVYIEYESSKGQKGWLYGSSDFIVFETSVSFIFVPRKSLLKFLNESQIVRWDLPYVSKPWHAKYRLFRRPKTLETITQIQVSDLLKIPNTKTWKKQ